MKNNIFQKILLIALSTTLFYGCLTPVKLDYTMKYYLNPAVSENKGESTGLSLAVRGLECSRSITNYVTFLENGKLYTRDGIEWAEHPGEVVERVIIKSLEKTGRFLDVSKSLEMKSPDLVLMGNLEKFYCVREKEVQKVLLSLSVRVRETRTGNILFNHEFVIEKNFNKDVESINQAMENVLSEFSLQLQQQINKIDFPENKQK